MQIWGNQPIFTFSDHDELLLANTNSGKAEFFPLYKPSPLDLENTNSELKLAPPKSDIPWNPLSADGLGQSLMWLRNAGEAGVS